MRSTPVWILLPLLLIGCSRSNIDEGAAPDKLPPRTTRNPVEIEADKVHAMLFAEKEFPSALTCGQCHPVQFRQWSISPHAYAQISPVFNALHGTILKLTNGTNGDFCIRCHNQVGMQKKEPLFISNLQRHPASREGITCVVCHRMNKNYGKVSGRFSIVRGDLLQPVYGPLGNERLKELLRKRPIKAVHKDVVKFFTLTTPSFCGTCHDVNLLNGFRLEEAFSNYKKSPSSAKGETCQDCHMGKTPGKNEGYDNGPAAIVSGLKTSPRKLTNHMIAGPDHSIVHPGIFPHNEQAIKLATMGQWLQFDYKADWGSKAFERKLKKLKRKARKAKKAGKPIPTLPVFPKPWNSRRARREGARIIKANLALYTEYTLARKRVLQAGFEIRQIKVSQANADGLRFKVEVHNPTPGHSTPTGFIGERLLYLEVTVTDTTGKVLFKSGDKDPNGDLRDLHSAYVHNGKLPLDRYLFNLQSKFLTRNLRGSEREAVIPVNFSTDPLPFLRPATRSTVLTGRPAGVRLHRLTIPPLTSRWAKYVVKADLLTGHPPYSATIKLIAGMVPVNLIAEIAQVGFDYDMSPREVARRIVEGHLVLWQKQLVLKKP